MRSCSCPDAVSLSITPTGEWNLIYYPAGASVAAACIPQQQHIHHHAHVVVCSPCQLTSLVFSLSPDALLQCLRMLCSFFSFSWILFSLAPVVWTGSRGTICNGGNIRIGVFGQPHQHLLRGKSPDTTAESASLNGQSLHNSSFWRRRPMAGAVLARAVETIVTAQLCKWRPALRHRTR